MWAENRRDSLIEPTTVTAKRLLEADDNAALHTYLFVNSHWEPRAIVIGLLEKRTRCVERVKNRLDQETRVNHIVVRP